VSATFDVQNPATGARVESVPNAGVAEARVAARRSIDASPG
jgi:acyl-CoA reductase-like NAD-dependent aldehyde dehydrogenase